MNAVARHAPAARWVSFAIDQHRFALPLACVVRILPAAEITPLPLAPDIVAGAIDVGGSILPVFDLRRRLRLPERALALDDQFVLARTARRAVALMVDRALGLLEAEPAHGGLALDPRLPHVSGVLTQPDGLVLIQDLEQFLSVKEEQSLDSALRAAEVRCTPTR